MNMNIVGFAIGSGIVGISAVNLAIDAITGGTADDAIFGFCSLVAGYIVLKKTA